MKHDDTTLQAAIDTAMLETRTGTQHNSLDTYVSNYWHRESPARLALAKAFLAKLPEPQPILADDGRSLGEVCADAALAAGLSRATSKECDEAAAQAVANVVLAQAIRRMEAVPVQDLLNILAEARGDGLYSLDRVRARLIAAARGEAEQQPVTETPAIEAADPYARLKAYAKAGARIRCGHDSAWRVGSKWTYIVEPSKYEVHPDDLHLVPEYAPVNEPPMQQVPLGPEDVMPGSVIRGRNWALDWGKCWLAVLETTPTGVHCNRGDEYRFTSLQYDWQINRSIPLTGKWDANAWEPCYKMI